MLTATDANGQTTAYQYDALNRILQKTFADGTSATYQYDIGNNGIGHLTQLTDWSGTTGWTYDQHGRVLAKQPA